ncbi:MAG: HAMP domain-containing sensor histidine kinase [Pseudomonadota bacterium]
MRLHFHYPGTFLRFTLLGFVAAAVPILAGLFYSVLALDRLALESQRVVYQGILALNGSRDLSDALVGMERGIRQYAILGDEDLRLAYDQAHQRFVDTGSRLRDLAWAPPQRQLLTVLLDGEMALHDKLAAHKLDARAVRLTVKDFAELGTQVQQFALSGENWVDQEVAGLQARVDKTRQRVKWMLFGLAPLGVLLVLGIPLLIAKPVRQIDAAIRGLREGELYKPIRLDGPSDMQYLAQRLDWLRQGLLDAEADKRRFLRHLSHELKTPLAALRESSDLLFDGSLGPLRPVQTEVVGILRQNGLRLQKLIEELLAYRSLREAPSSLQAVEFAFEPLLDQVLESHRPALMARNLEVERQGTAMALVADPEKVRVIMDNLLSNAIKFSPPRGRIRVVTRPTDGARIIEVVDQGPGVDPADRGRVFDAFYQGQPPRDAPVRGTGLGLAIVREHVLAHGGTVEIAESQGQGACFRVSLPQPDGEWN